LAPGSRCCFVGEPQALPHLFTQLLRGPSLETRRPSPRESSTSPTD
jgi:hypothetical protein